MGGGGSKDFNYREQLLHDHRAQSVFADGTKSSDDVTACLRDPTAKEGFVGFLKLGDGDDEKTGSGEGITNCIGGMQRSAKLYPTRSCLGWRTYSGDLNEKGRAKRGNYVYQNYADAWAEMQACGKGLYELLQSDTANVGIYGRNRPEWCISAFGCYTQKYRSVALYDTLGAEAVQYIIGHAELIAICCEKNKLPNLFKALESDNPNDDEIVLRYIIQWDHDKKYNNTHEAISDEDRARASALGIELIGLTKIIANGKDSGRAMQEPTPDDIAYIMYTSGTTGLPKGVLLSHGNFAVTVASVYRWMAPIVGTSVQKHVSFLPLAHSFEALMHQMILAFGGIVAYQQGNIKMLTHDWIAIKPTILAGVPRVYQKIYDKVMNNINSEGCAKKWFIGMALNKGNEKIRKNERSAYFDKKVWAVVRAKVGWDDIKMIVSGAAPLPPYLGEFLKVMSGCPVVQGYGMTETTALGTKMNVGDSSVGHCGVPFDNIEVRLQSVKEMNYLVTDTVTVDGQTLPAPRGEVQMRGPSIFKGYFKAEAKTKETITADGWLLSGDIGRINPNGTLSIIDRKKNIFKTSFGEYIAAEKIEGVYQKAESVGQIFVYGNSYKSKIMAVVVPDATWCMGFLESKGHWTKTEGSPADTPATAEFATKFLKTADAHKAMIHDAAIELMRAEEGGLKKIERVVDIVIETEIDELTQGFNVNNNCLTPTFKLRRKNLLDKYREQISQVYTDCGEPANDQEEW